MIVDDEEAARYGMRRALTTFGYNISEAGSAEAARALLKQQEPDLLLLDVNLPGMSGLDFLRELKGSNGHGPLVIIVTAHGSERMAVEAVKAGAHDYLSKPFELDDLRLVIKNAAETVQLRRENYSLRRRIEVERSQRGALIGNSEAMQRVRAMIEKVSETDATILVRGESGTGKELVAREIHERNSVRHNGAFVAVNCAALPADLFYRLRVVTIEIAPLRERREDIPVLAETFLRLATERYELPQRPLSQGALKPLVEYNWPGNVRELKNTIDRAVIMAEGDEVHARDLPDEITAGLLPSAMTEGEEGESGAVRVPFTADFREDRREFERRYITRCLEHTQGNVTRAAEILAMHRQSLQHKLRQLGLGRRYVSVGGDAQDNSGISDSTQGKSE